MYIQHVLLVPVGRAVAAALPRRVLYVSGLGPLLVAGLEAPGLAVLAAGRPGDLAPVVDLDVVRFDLVAADKGDRLQCVISALLYGPTLDLIIENKLKYVVTWIVQPGFRSVYPR